MTPRVLAHACAFILLCSCACFASAAPQDAGEAFAAGSRAFENGDWSGALAWFEAAREQGMEDAAVRYNIGVCQYRLGAYGRAERSFLELAERYPQMASLAHYNAGLALYRQGRTARAAAAFERAATSEDPTIARLAAAMRERIEPPRPAAVPGAWTGFVDLALGFDDNVALVDDASLPAGESTDSPLAAFFGQLERRPGGAGFGGSASAYLVRYPDAGRFDQNILQLAGTWSAAGQDWRLGAGPHVSFSTLDGDSFERRLGASVTLARALDPATRFTARTVLESVEELDPRFAFVDGSRAFLELEIERRTGRGRVQIGYAFSVDDRAEASVSPTRHRFTLGYRLALDDRWSMAAAAAFRSSRYDDPAAARDEDRGELALVLSRNLPREWQLALD